MDMSAFIAFQILGSANAPSITSNGLVVGIIAAFAGVFGTTAVSVFRSGRQSKEEAAKEKDRKEQSDLADVVKRLENMESRQTKVDEWLMGTKDVFGKDKGDGFATTFPIWQMSLDKRFDDLTSLVQRSTASIRQDTRDQNALGQ